jgi:plasmid stability protein
MSMTMVQIRNVPEEFHRRLKARAAMEGMSMSDYILREVGKALERPTRREVLERIRTRPPRKLTPSAAEVIRAERNAR